MTTTLKLYELPAEFAALDELLEESEGEITPAIEELMNGLELAFADKVDSVTAVIQHKTLTAAAAKQEEQRLAARRKSAERAADSLKAYLQRNLEAVGKRKVETDRFTVSIADNPPSVRGELSQEQLSTMHALEAPFVERIPESFRLDRRAVLETYKHTGFVPEGLEIGRGTSLRIR